MNNNILIEPAGFNVYCEICEENVATQLATQEEGQHRADKHRLFHQHSAQFVHTPLPEVHNAR